jgi:diaminohydroxyphosphoribosylaminopyrimidine deaminase/5-amino-6-(5-phosphoribosylamino)uracil reductase
MVGIGTVLEDDPQLTDRRAAAADRQPARIVLDSGLRTPVDSTIVRGARDIETIIACGGAADAARGEALRSRGIELWECPTSGNGLDLEHVLRRAASHGFIHVLCEGGAGLATSLMRERHVDRVAFFVAPIIFGAGGLSAFGDLGRGRWLGRADFSGVKWTETDEDLLFEAEVLKRA